MNVKELGIKVKHFKTIVEIRPREVVMDNASSIKNIREGVIVPVDEETVPADTVVLAVGRQPNNCLMDQLVGFVPEIYSIGDCVEPSLCISATRDGAWIGRVL